MLCLYCREEKTNESFTKDEHIIPAAFGGKTVLPPGYVCDDCNLHFGKGIESELASSSFISYLRTYIGPGVRGSLSEKKAVRSRISLLGINIENYPNLLGYIKKSKPILIPQFVFDFKNKSMRFFYDPMIGQEKQLNLFLSDLPITQNKVKPIETNQSPEINIIGYFEGNYYSHAKTDYIVAECLDKINGQFKERPYNDNLEQSSVYQAELTRGLETFVNHENYIRACSKISFNCAAHFLGHSKMLDSGFDSIRDWIRYGTGNSKDFQLPSKIVNSMKQHLINSFPDKSHKVTLFSLDTMLIGLVSFYGSEHPVAILIKKNFDSNIFFNGLICDWKLEEEYTLLNYLNKIGREAESV